MNGATAENQRLEALPYLPLEQLEQLLELTLFLIRRAQLANLALKRAPPSTSELSLQELLLQGPTLTDEECQMFAENRQWMATWKGF